VTSCNVDHTVYPPHKTTATFQQEDQLLLR